MIKKIMISASLLGIILVTGFTLPHLKKSSDPQMLTQAGGDFSKLAAGFTLPYLEKSSAPESVKQVGGYFGKMGSGLAHAVIFNISGGSVYGPVIAIQASNAMGGCGTLDLVYSYDTPYVEYHSRWVLKYPITVYTSNGNITVGSGSLSGGYAWCP